MERRRRISGYWSADAGISGGGGGGGGDGEKGRAPGSRQGSAAMVREAFLKAQVYLQGWKDFRSGTRPAPPDRDLKMDTLAGVLTGDIPVHMHCYRASDMVAMLGVARMIGSTA